MHIPITIFTGFVGAGKTTTILGLLSSLPQGYRACLLKNEFGDVEVDSQLAKQSSLAAVDEILNGCMCCVLVGQMKTALLEIRDKYRPDRIFIETSGSAFPATLAFQIRELERETNDELKLDAIVTVIDAENFIGYEDTSPTAKMQASYTDVILVNKWESVSERQLDIVMDHLYTLNELTPKIKCDGKGGVDPGLIFGLDSKLFLDPSASLPADAVHNDEIQAVTIRSDDLPFSHNGLSCSTDSSCHHHDQTPAISHSTTPSLPPLTADGFSSILAEMPKEVVWRIKGFVQLDSPSSVGSTYVVNWAFGRSDLTPFMQTEGERKPRILLNVMGERGEVMRYARRLAQKLGAVVP